MGTAAHNIYIQQLMSTGEVSIMKHILYACVYIVYFFLFKIAYYGIFMIDSLGVGFFSP